MNTICRRCKKDFLIDENDQTFYQKMNVPNPTECPDCRFMCRAMWRNETTLYSRNCDMCQNSIISMYNPKSPYVVYCNDCYRGDSWDSKAFAQDYDFSKSFFEQLDELFKKVPKATLFDASGYGPNIRSDYVNASASLKDCYLVFNTGPAENTYYSRGCDLTNEVSDAYFCTKDDLSYEIINTHESSRVSWSKNLKSCINCLFCEDMSGCFDCFGCVGLRNKSLHIYNKQVTKTEYDIFIENFTGSYKRYIEEFEKFNLFRLQFPKRENNNLNSVNSIGDYLNETKNVLYSFEIRGGGENSKYCFGAKGIKDSYGVMGYGVKSEMLLECVSTGNSSFILGSYAIDQSQNVFYSFSCRSTNSDLLGCDSLKKAQYCILNKQYPKDEYEKLRNHIVAELIQNGDYGLMIPPELSPFGYNETAGNDNMPLSKEEALKLGFKWQDDIQKTIGKETIQSEDLEDNIIDTPDTITQEILRCIDCSRNYKITEPELFFYQQMKLPLPRKCFFCRHHDRIEKRGPYRFWNRNCALCKKDIVTNYAPERPEIVYCEECYKREVL